MAVRVESTPSCKDTAVSDQNRAIRVDVLVGAAALFIFAAGAAGAIVLGEWRVAKLGLIAAVIVYVLASLVAVMVRKLRRPRPLKPDRRRNGRS
jgi:membrane protein implicated in regulation of membrane protease activity